ncbi:hypothetical protein GALLR39Z86_11530 [Glycomyces algeriensis]|uniref:Uncharacterized protein n=1 Tax=Glycomyces algeriensis TaxID=256037 RepID=A0A9W6G6T5_9ACTN|nr:hypothetical protein GALLR39Z86_11530 [Glycomyces algeriensis]
MRAVTCNTPSKPRTSAPRIPTIEDAGPPSGPASSQRTGRACSRETQIASDPHTPAAFWIAPAHSSRTIRFPPRAVDAPRQPSRTPGGGKPVGVRPYAGIRDAPPEITCHA